MRDHPGGRRKSREILFRVFFETDTSGDDAREIFDYALGRFRLTEDGRDYALRTLEVWLRQREEIDHRIRAQLANWELKRLSSVVRAVLRLAMAELLDPEGGPARVVLDQAIELARKYGEDGADAFVNGVLDPIAAELRPAELGTRGEG